VNVLLFVYICSVFAIALLLALVIPSDMGRSVEKYFIGLHRHDWADLHFYLALFLALPFDFACLAELEMGGLAY